MKNRLFIFLALLTALCLCLTACSAIANIGTKRRLEDFEQSYSEQAAIDGQTQTDKASSEPERTEPPSVEGQTEAPVRTLPEPAVTAPTEAETTEAKQAETETEPAAAAPDAQAPSEAPSETGDALKKASTESMYVCNTNTKKFHYPDCSSVREIKDKNRRDFTGSREELIAEGYQPCKRCNP